MNRRQLFMPNDVPSSFVEDTVRRINEIIDLSPEAKDDYVLVEIINKKSSIKFFRKDRVDQACATSGISPKDFITSVFRTCIHK